MREDGNRKRIKVIEGKAYLFKKRDGALICHPKNVVLFVNGRYIGTLYHADCVDPANSWYFWCRGFECAPISKISNGIELRLYFD
jgi:hypothetical protein